MTGIKQAVTKYPVIESIKNRWSPRSFSGKAIATDDLETIIEAGSWAFSAMNEQPWRYIVATKGSPLFDALFNLLFPGNQPWNKQAGALVLSLTKKTIGDQGKLNTSALHDVGAANMLLTLQANSMGIYTHLMEGFSRPDAAKLFDLGENLEPVVMIALGYPDAAERLAEPFRTRELAPRNRKALSEVIINTF